MGFFLYWAFADQDLGDLWQSITGISAPWVALVTLITISTLLIRAWRWNVLMRPFAPQVRVVDSSLALAICYASNVAIPRSGEVLRTVSLKWTRQAPISPMLATVVVERIIDLFMLIVFIGLALLVQRDPINEAYPSLEIASLAVMGLCVVALIGLVFISIYRDRALALLSPWIERLFPPFAERIVDLLHTFIAGLESLQNPLAYAQLALSSLLLNTGYVLIIYATFWGMGLAEAYHLGLAASLVIMAISSLGVIVPTPGGMGSYHIAFALPLQQLYHLPETQALACATLAHALATLTYIVIGAPALLYQWMQQRRSGDAPSSLYSTQTTSIEPPT